LRLPAPPCAELFAHPILPPLNDPVHTPAAAVQHLNVVPAPGVSLYFGDALERPTMPTISIQRRHKLEHQKAKAAAQKIAKDLHQRFDLQCTWDGDNVSFQRPGLSGQMRVGKNDVELNVRLSFLLTPLKVPIEHAIRDELDTLFGEV
jgi:putative polyhydroxyalkanoate system protein